MNATLFLPSFPVQSLSGSFFDLSPTRCTAEVKELRVCTNRTCRRQGSFQTLETLAGLVPPAVSVRSCGCLGRCGAGPNVAVLPAGVVVGHCGTPACAAQVMVELCGGSGGDAARTLEALAWRKRAEGEREKGNFSEAEILLSQALALKPFGGIHIIHRERSVARLMLGSYTEALEDANEALALAPHSPEAYICQGDAFLALEQFDAAKKSYSEALQIDPSIRRSKSFKSRILKLEERIPSATAP